MNVEAEECSVLNQYQENRNKYVEKTPKRVSGYQDVIIGSQKRILQDDTYGYSD